jgi:pSer/pThr/pTyr-binding forkhead associated (FHA) protein
MWILKRRDGEVDIQVFRIGEAVRTLGRGAVADFVVDAPLVSRVHCRLLLNPEGVLEVEDLDSTNGTYVNDRRVTRSVLVAGDTLRVGRMDLVVCDAAEASYADALSTPARTG